jgi:hypothetical protein
MTVDDSLRVPGLPWLYAIGDVSGRSLLTHMGKYQAHVVSEAIAGGHARATRDNANAPRVVFTDPQVAAAGLTLQAARDAGEHETVRYDAALQGVRSPLPILGRRASSCAGSVSEIAGRGEARHTTPAAARHYASAFDREDRDQLGRRAPLLGMFPLRIWHKIHERKQQR